MNNSRFSSNGFAANGTAELRVCPGVEGLEARGGEEPRRLEDSPAGLGSSARLDAGVGVGKGEKEGRDEAGRFARGCKAGPGNPYNRQVALLKRELLAAATPEDVREIGKRLVAEAKDGNVAAARVLFMYVLPKNVEPDRVHLDEWDGYRKEKGMMYEMPSLLKELEPDVTLSIVGEMRPGTSKAVGDLMLKAMRGEIPGLAGLSGLRPAEKKAEGKRGKRRDKRGKR